jgi:hypothetical protein
MLVRGCGLLAVAAVCALAPATGARAQTATESIFYRFNQVTGAGPSFLMQASDGNPYGIVAGDTTFRRRDHGSHFDA